MSRHLSPEAIVAAIERSLDAPGAAHLDGCEQCQRDVSALRAMLSDVEGAADSAEPSPLFWDHFSARVHTAVGATAPARLPAWRRWWQPAIGLAAGSLLAVWLVGRDSGSPPPVVPVGDRTDLADAVATPDAPWDAVVQLAADLSVDEVDGAVPFRLDAIALFDELTAEERETFDELLRAEMKGLE